MYAHLYVHFREANNSVLRDKTNILRFVFYVLICNQGYLQWMRHTEDDPSLLFYLESTSRISDILNRDKNLIIVNWKTENIP